jgi:hypothetical protein
MVVALYFVAFIELASKVEKKILEIKKEMKTKSTYSSPVGTG